MSARNAKERLSVPDVPELFANTQRVLFVRARNVAIGVTVFRNLLHQTQKIGDTYWNIALKGSMRFRKTFRNVKVFSRSC